MKLFIKIIILLFNLVLAGLLAWSYFAPALPYSRDFQTFKLFAIGALLLSSVVIYCKRIRGCPFRKFEWTQTGVESKAGQKSYIYTNLEILTFVYNMSFFGYVCWVYLNVIPLPPEGGIIASAIMVGIAPVINLLALLCCRIQS